MRWRVPLLTLCLFGFGFPAAAAETPAAREQAAQARLNPAEPEDMLIQTLEQFENEFPDSPTAAAKVLPFVRDERPKVRRTAVRVLGVLQADLGEKGLADVTKMLSSGDKEEVVDALKALRWLYAPSTIPPILPLLSDSDEHVRREACRALAVIGDRSVISKIEPLLKDPIKDVREDAEGSIAQLRKKPSGIADQGSAPPARTARAVVLKVVDNRPPREGGREPRVVGFRRSMVGIKANIRESGPEVVPNLVRAATEDALGRSGIDTSDGAKVTLAAQILCYWMDWSGFAFAGPLSHLKYQGTIAVEYTLQDATGRVLWKGLAVTEQHHSSDSKEKIFNPALKRLVRRAANRFQSTEFTNAVPQT